MKDASHATRTHEQTGLTLELLDRESLSADSHLRRREMLADLHAHLARRRRTRARTAAGASMAALAGLALLVGFGLRPAAPATIAPQVPVLTATGPRTPHNPPPSTAIVHIADTRPIDVLTRLAAAPPTFRIRTLSDQQAVQALERAGEPGLIMINGRAVLRRDLARGSLPAPGLDDQPEVPGPGARGFNEAMPPGGWSACLSLSIPLG